MFGHKTLDRLDRMLDEAIQGTFRESDYDESKLSRVESKWKHFLGASVISRENIEEERNRVKELVSDISHQTKTPMANIRLYTELLRENLLKENLLKENLLKQNLGKAHKDASENAESAEDAEGAWTTDNLRIVEEIDRQAAKLEFLIQSLTKMSRLESNIVEVKPAEQKLSVLIDAAVQDVLPKAEKKGVKIVNTYAGEGNALYDMKWTKEALFNVLDNAVKYSPAGSKVTISVAEYKIYTAISVKDEGIGIEEGDTAKIFTRFYRAEEVQQEDGVGIGLYLTREILKKENGYIKVKSKKGEGAQFMLYLQNADM